MAHSHAKSFSESIKSNLCPKIIPSKDDNIPTIIFKIIYAIVILLIIIITVGFSIHFAVIEKQYNSTAQARELWYDFSLTQQEKSNALKQLNSDFRFWLKIDNTLIDNPVYQARNNKYYLNHNLNGNRSSEGALFISSNDDTSDKSNDKNIIVYGQNMQSGEMFGTLNYFKSKSFLKYNPSITVSDSRGTYKYFVFAVIVLDSSEDYNEKSDFDITKSYFSDNLDFLSWSNNISKRSIIKTDVDIKSNDSFITLITPSDDFETANLAVMGRMQRDKNETDLVLNAKINSDVIYPKIWYEKRGLKIPE